MLKQKAALLMACCCIIAIFVNNRQRKQYWLTKNALVATNRSPWSRLYRNANYGSFLTIVGMTRNVFRELKRYLFVNYNEGRVGRPHSMPNSTMLGIILIYLGSCMRTKDLCLIFGIAPTTLQRVINKMLYMINTKLIKHEFAKVEWPSQEKKQYWASLVQAREPLVKNVIGFVDGVALAVKLK
jgi:hypothetical protein